MKSKVVLITGCHGGIGRAICEEFLLKQWKVVGIDKVDKNVISDPNFQFFQGDIGDIEKIVEVMTSIKSDHGQLHALVNNAAIQICKPFYEMKDDEWDQMMDINLKAPFQLIREGYDLLKKEQGAVINISSVHAVATSKEIAAYATSKGGLSAMTRALSVECSPDGVRVNAIQPGAVDTEMLRDGLKRNLSEDHASENELIRALGLKHLVGRVGTPKEVARAAYFLANNEQSSFITGQCLTVDGGATIKLSTE